MAMTHDQPVNGPPPWVLVLEDHIAMRHAIVALLRRAGFVVDTTACPFEALEMLVSAEQSIHPLMRGSSYDLILCDHDLGCPGLHLTPDLPTIPVGWEPRLDGAAFIDAAKRLASAADPRPDCRLSHVPPIIGISAMESLNARMIAHGAVAGIPKGRFENDLLPTIERVLIPLGYKLPPAGTIRRRPE